MANRNTKIRFREPQTVKLTDTSLVVVTGQITLGGGFYQFADLPGDVLDVSVMSDGEAVSVFYMSNRTRLNLEPTKTSFGEQVVSALIRPAGITGTY